MPEISQIQLTKATLKLAGLKPKEFLGQNFLVDQNVLGDIVAAADLKKSDEVLEVGPGLGILTEQLSSRAKRVLAVEKDRRLLRILEQKFLDDKNVELAEGDILRFHFAQRFKSRYKVVANIPYYLTSKLISVLLEQDRRPDLIVLMIQKEVAERITAKAGDMSVLALSVKFFAEAEIIRLVPKQSFWPVPEVDSAVIRITPKTKLPSVDRKAFFRLLHLAFSGKRKQIHNTLGKALGISREQLNDALSGIGLDASVRPQQLTLDQWLTLSEKLIPKRG